MNRSMAWLPINRCRDFLGADNKNTSLSLILADNSQLDAERSKLAGKLQSGSYEVMTWQEMMPELDQFYKAKMAQNMIMSGVLYLVIAFGIFGTILMMLNERQHEFGILIAIGMRKNILALIVVIEMAMMSVIGAFMGIVLALPITWFFWLHPFRFSGNTAKVMERFNLEPVIRPSLNFTHFVLQTYVVLGISLVLSVFAVYRIFKIKAISAINS